MSDLLQGEDVTDTFPQMELSQIIYRLELTMKSNGDCTALLASLMQYIDDHEMGPFYEHCCGLYAIDLSATKLNSLKEKNENAIKEIQTKMEEAETNAGDTEVIDAMFEKAKYYTKIGDWNNANIAYDEIVNKPKVVTSKKVDVYMSKSRIALFTMDTSKAKEFIDEAKRLNETHGDWDHRNRLKVYEAMYLMAIRDINGASTLLESCIATFTCNEMCTYNQFMFYALLASLMHLPRTQLKKKIIDNPQVISVIKEVPCMHDLLHSFHNCDYGKYMKTLLDVNDQVLQDRYLGPHAVYISRELRVLAYSQFLEAYRSIMLSSMAQSFGITVELLDRELSHFIASSRLNAKIDKVGDVIETSRPDKKNAQYQEIIKKGDMLLNQIQKLVRVVDS